MVQQPLERSGDELKVGVVCVLHGGVSVPAWLRDRDDLDVTLNDPLDHSYDEMPPSALVTRNDRVRGFAENVNAALGREFSDLRRDMACVVNFDLQASPETITALVATLEAEPTLAAVGPLMQASDGEPTFSVGVHPTPAREFLRAAGLRLGALRRAERTVLRRTRRWSARNHAPPSGWRALSQGEYLPWTCVAVRAHAWQEVGELDERFTLYAEDIDWSLRAQAAGWQLAVCDCGRVIHEERATRDPRADALYEQSHLELHAKWGWRRNLAWQRRALRLRRVPPFRWLTPRLDWSLLASLDETPSA
jgi:GT2 family glycosyltransferase